MEKVCPGQPSLTLLLSPLPIFSLTGAGTARLWPGAHGVMRIIILLSGMEFAAAERKRLPPCFAAGAHVQRANKMLILVAKNGGQFSPHGCIKLHCCSAKLQFPEGLMLYDTHCQHQHVSKRQAAAR